MFCKKNIKKATKSCFSSKILQDLNLVRKLLSRFLKGFQRPVLGLVGRYLILTAKTNFFLI